MNPSSKNCTEGNDSSIFVSDISNMSLIWPCLGTVTLLVPKIELVPPFSLLFSPRSFQEFCCLLSSLCCYSSDLGLLLLSSLFVDVVKSFSKLNSRTGWVSHLSLVSFALFIKDSKFSRSGFQLFCYDWFDFFSYFTNNITSNAVILYRFRHTISGFISWTVNRVRKVSWSVYKECTSRGWSFS